jgi:predicted ArsR family transcriptional regulator
MWNKRMWDSTKGRIVRLLRRRERTVDELAGELGLTDNAVRAQLGPLERDGVVRVAGTRKPAGAGKPAAVYQLPLETDALFSRAYAPMFTSLVTALADRLDGDELEAVLVDAGRRLAAAHPVAAGDARQRLDAATEVLRELGAEVDVIDLGGHVTLRGSACPLGVAVEKRHEVCTAMQAFLEAMLDQPLRRCCSYEERPRCCFETARLCLIRSPDAVAASGA